MREFLSFAW
jgi:hypothetical protein